MFHHNKILFVEVEGKMEVLLEKNKELGVDNRSLGKQHCWHAMNNLSIEVFVWCAETNLTLLIRLS